MIFSTAITGYISVKALNWLSARRTGLSFYFVNGEPIYTAIPNYPERDPHIQIRQFQAFANEKTRANIAKYILNTKYSKANALLKYLGHEPLSTDYEEQTFSRLYWLKLREKIREYGYAFDTRKGVNRVLNRSAVNPINAILNLMYGFLEGKILLEIAKAGLNPHISFLHKPTFAKQSLAYDIIEFFRSDIDAIVLKMLENKELKPETFKIVQNSYYMVREPSICIEKLKGIDVSSGITEFLYKLSS